MTVLKTGAAPPRAPTSPAPGAGAPAGQVKAADGSLITWSTAANGAIKATAGVKTLLLTRSSGPSGHSEATTYCDLASGVPYLSMTSLVSAALDTVTLTTRSGRAELTTTFENPPVADTPAKVTVSGRLKGKAVDWTGTVDRAAPTDFVANLPPAVSQAFRDQFLKASYFAPALKLFSAPAKTTGAKKVVAMVADGGGSGGGDFSVLAHAAVAFAITEAFGAAKGAGFGLVAGPEAAPIGAAAGLIEALPEAICTATIVLTAETVETGGAGSSDGPPSTGDGSALDGGAGGGADGGSDAGSDDGSDGGSDGGFDGGSDGGTASAGSGSDGGDSGGGDSGGGGGGGGGGGDFLGGDDGGMKDETARPTHSAKPALRRRKKQNFA